MSLNTASHLSRTTQQINRWPSNFATAAHRTPCPSVLAMGKWGPLSNKMFLGSQTGHRSVSHFCTAHLHGKLTNTRIIDCNSPPHLMYSMQPNNKHVLKYCKYNQLTMYLELVLLPKYTSKTTSKYTCTVQLIMQPSLRNAYVVVYHGQNACRTSSCEWQSIVSRVVHAQTRSFMNMAAIFSSLMHTNLNFFIEFAISPCPFTQLAVWIAVYWNCTHGALFSHAY